MIKPREKAASKDILQTARVLHLVGIGGIGLSALARLFLLQGKKVFGSDIARSIVTDELKKNGARIYLGHKADHLPPKTDLLIYSRAVPTNNPERRMALSLGIPCLSYPKALGLVARGKETIAIAGTHGKTTTTAMVGEILRGAGFEPTVLVGSLLKSSSSNLLFGRGRHFVVEADEYRRAFLNLQPKILVITNIEADHLDYYRDLRDVQKAFVTLVAKMGEEGVLVSDPTLPNLRPVLRAFRGRVLDYTTMPVNFPLKVMGAHNVLNAKAAYAVAEALDVPGAKITVALKNFCGTWRRQEYLGQTAAGAKIYDDYAHHPTEVRTTLAAFREKFPLARIIAVFMPHLYSRTRDFLREFGKSFSLADDVIVTDIFPARERDDGTIHARDLVREVGKHHPRVCYIGKLPTVRRYLLKCAKKKDVILTLGAGDIYKVAERLAGKRPRS